MTFVPRKYWDQLCLVCGVCPAGGPSSLLRHDDLPIAARQIASEIRDGDEELYSVVKEGLSATFHPDEKRLDFRHSYLPDGLGYDVDADRMVNYSTSYCVAIGYFSNDEDGKAPTREVRVPDGRNVRVRQVLNNFQGGDFVTVVRLSANGRERRDEVKSACSVEHENNPNFALCERCYYFLKNWIDQSSLPSADCDLSFAGELYEIINSQEPRRDPISGLLPCLNYDGIEASLCEEFDYRQSWFLPCRRGSKFVSKAIDAGLRGAQLIPALMRDCRAWMFMRPDIWPTPPAKPDTAVSFNPVGPPQSTPPIYNMPNELLLPILRDLTPADILALSASCRALRTLITEREFLCRVLLDAILRGSLQYVLPINGPRSERERAFNDVRLWLPEAVRPPELAPLVEEECWFPEDNPPPIQPRDIPTLESLLRHPQFPLLAFVRACWESDSMRNRRRLYRMVKQVEGLWRDFRKNGHPDDRFFPSEEILGELYNDPPEFQPVCDRKEAAGLLTYNVTHWMYG